MYNTKTNNKSFINGWKYLQDNNIDNNIFMLELKNEYLKSFNSTLLENDKFEREKIINTIIKECRENIWFFFREILKFDISNSIYKSSFIYDNINISPFILSKESLEILFLYSKGYSIIIDSEEIKYDMNSYIRSFQTISFIVLYELIMMNNKIKIDDRIKDDIINNKMNIMNGYYNIYNLLPIPDIDISLEESHKNNDFNTYFGFYSNINEEELIKTINGLIKSNIQSIIITKPNFAIRNNLKNELGNLCYDLLTTKFDIMKFDKELPNNKFIII